MTSNDEESRFPERYTAIARVYSDVSKDRGAFNFRVKQYKPDGTEGAFSKTAVKTPNLSHLKGFMVLTINYKCQHTVYIA
jgi:hypothetical protein